MVRAIRYIVIHCTATPVHTKIASIQRYWRETKKWRHPGYHVLIDSSGVCHHLQPYNKPANGVKGHNQHALHLSYIGGVDSNLKPKDTRTPAQLSAMTKLLEQLKETYPTAEILGHRDFDGVKKACPSFDVKTWLGSVGLG